MKFDGFGERVGYGSRPAICVIDLNLAYTSPSSPLVCPLDGQIAATRRLLEVARRTGVPIIFTTVVHAEKDRELTAAFLRKIPALSVLKVGSGLSEIDPRLEPAPSEPILIKLFASSFFGTDLADRLGAHGIDTLILAGASTSGCVRATAVDGLQHGLRVIVPEEVVGDRNQDAHDASLYDIDTKHGDVVTLENVIEWLESRDVNSVAPNSKLGREK